MDQGYAIYPINPKAVDRYRDRHHTSGTKDDIRDAQTLAHILRTDQDVRNLTRLRTRRVLVSPVQPWEALRIGAARLRLPAELPVAGDVPG